MTGSIVSNRGMPRWIGVLLVAGIAVCALLGGQALWRSGSGIQHQVFEIRQTSAEVVEAYLRDALPVEHFRYKLFRNVQAPREISVLADSATRKLIGDTIERLEQDALVRRSPSGRLMAADRPPSWETSTEVTKTPVPIPATAPTWVGTSPEFRPLPPAASAAPGTVTPPDYAGARTGMVAHEPGQPTLGPSSALPELAAAGGAWQTLSLQSAEPQRVQQRLAELMQASSTSERRGDGVVFACAVGGAAPLRIGWHDNGRQVYCQGPPRLCEQMERLVRQLDQPVAAGSAGIAIPVHRAPAGAVQTVLHAFGVGPEQAEGSLSAVANVAYNAPASGAQTSVGIGSTLPLQDTGAGGPPALQLPSNTMVQEPVAGNQPDQMDEEALRQLRDSVQVETLPDLGIIILRGRQKEVEELSRIIQELERLSADTIPELKIIELQHTRGDAIQQIIQTVSADLVNVRQGKVTVTPLIKPNALLLVGWGEAVGIVADLIAKLDQPVDAGTQFEVFRLQEAKAPALQTSITAFFTNRAGLGPRVQVLADPRSNSLIVYAAPRDMEEVRRLIDELDVPGFHRKQQARVVKIRNGLAAELATTLQNAIKAARGTEPQQSAMLELLAIDAAGQQVLRSGILDQVEITPNPVNNSLIISGPVESMDLVDALIQQLDVVGSTAQIKVFRVENGDAASLVQMLRSLLPEETAAALKLSSDSEEASLAPLRFTIDARTNSIIATGSEGDLRIIEALLLRLDEREFSERKNSVYRLKNAPATDVALAINNFLRSERQAEEVTPGTLSPFEQIEREVVVVPEPIGNRLIVSATPRYYEEIENLIEQLDEPPPQVMIQVLIAEVSLDNIHEFGVELGLQDSILFDRSLLDNLITTTRTTNVSTPNGIVTTTQEVIQSATNQPGFNFNNMPLGNSGSQQALATSNDVGGQGLTNFAVGRMNNEIGFGGLVLSASSESISLLIRALEENKRLEVLSRPQVRTLDNQPAFIQVGQRVPRIVGSTVNQNGQSNAITLENVGLILGVTPRISPDGAVVMEVDAERSALGPEAEGIPVSIAPNGSVIRSPRIDTTTAQATVSASSGETIILGGLITKRTHSIDRRVPVLSELPLLGDLFKYDYQQQRRSELLIVLTPYVIRGPEDEYRMKQAEYARMSWCLCDIEQIHGDIGAAATTLPALQESPNTEVIYPENESLPPEPAASEGPPERRGSGPRRRDLSPADEPSGLNPRPEPLGSNEKN